MSSFFKPSLINNVKNKMTGWVGDLYFLSYDAHNTHNTKTVFKLSYNRSDSLCFNIVL